MASYSTGSSTVQPGLSYIAYTGDTCPDMKTEYNPNVYTINTDACVVYPPEQYWRHYYSMCSCEQNKQGQKQMIAELTNHIKRIFSPSKQTLYKAQYLDYCGQLTEEGKRELFELLLEKFEDDMVKLAEEKIAEAEKTKSKN